MRHSLRSFKFFKKQHKRTLHSFWQGWAPHSFPFRTFRSFLKNRIDFLPNFFERIAHSLISSEQPEGFDHGRSFDLSEMSAWVNDWWANSQNCLKDKTAAECWWNSFFVVFLISFILGKYKVVWKEKTAAAVLLKQPSLLLFICSFFWTNIKLLERGNYCCCVGETAFYCCFPLVLSSQSRQTSSCWKDENCCCCCVSETAGSCVLLMNWKLLSSRTEWQPF